MAEAGPGGGGTRYRGGFHPDTWEEELEAIPMFMKRCPAEIDAARQPELACLQSLLFDEEQGPAELARMYKNEGNEYFRERDYGRAVVAYTEGLKKKCEDPELNAVLHTNRGAAQFYLGNYRSALNDAVQAKKLKPTHLKAVIRGALCHMELKNFSEAIAWCEEGLRIDSKEKKLVEMRAKADKLKRAEERDARKAKVMKKKEQCQKEILLAAIKVTTNTKYHPSVRRWTKHPRESSGCQAVASHWPNEPCFLCCRWTLLQWKGRRLSSRRVEERISPGSSPSSTHVWAMLKYFGLLCKLDLLFCSCLSKEKSEFSSVL
ncbi:tetratricopeptide repeat protein 4 isoform X2 [Accipiter gentilis]|uniref:tetratricopeptide repeat protein 4 isoform X2 n=1 Tax=Astur gentilis TaxID=8957 RepID=UPI00210FEBD5|nr:tetratricopeptide repeat protein 4 isoform X2 [Accipiter gentilis]